MKLTLKRNIFTTDSTIGELFIDGKFECFVLEDTDRDLNNLMPLDAITAIKIKGSTCIPYGEYRIHNTFSNRFQKILPLLEGVKGFEGIRIHPGNSSADTEGCLLPGTAKANNLVLHSRNAFQNLWNKLEDETEITILITK
jgi:hypothetical protein